MFPVTMLTGIILFFLGLFIGSFLGVIIDRLPRNETIWIGRSHCEYCKHVLSWYDLIPIFSFILLFGKCRYCKRFIGWRYPIVELTTGVLFGLYPIFFISSQNTNFILSLLYYLLIVSSMVAIFFIDLFDGIIPDVILLFIFLFSFPYIFFQEFSLLPSHFLSAILAFILFLFLAIITKGKGMGFGDVKFAFIIGFLFGYPGTVIALYIAFISGAIVSVALLIRKKKKLKSTIAFGPFLVFGTFMTLLWGNALWSIFSNFLLRLPYS